MKQKIMVILTIWAILALNFAQAQTKFAINGQIVNADRQPVPFTALSLYKLQDIMLIKTIQSDKTGNFHLNNLEAGAYYLKIDQPGYLAYKSDPIRLNKSNTVIYVPNIILNPAVNKTRNNVSKIRSTNQMVTNRTNTRNNLTVTSKETRYQKTEVEVKPYESAYDKRIAQQYKTRKRFTEEDGKKLQNELYADCLIKDKNNTSYILSNAELKVDGVKQPENLRKKYADKYLYGTNMSILYNYGYNSSTHKTP